MLEAAAVGVDGLGVVLDDEAACGPVGDGLLNGRHVGALAVEMHGNDGLGLGRDGRLDEVGPDALGVRTAVYEHRGGPGDPDRLGGREKGVGVCDHLVAGPDVQRHQCQPDRVGAVAQANSVARP